MAHLLESTQGWLRLWIVTSVIWTVAVASLQYGKLPDKYEVRREYLSQTYDFFGLEEKIKIVESECEKKSQENQNLVDSFTSYKECIDVRNRDNMKSNLASLKKSHYKGADEFVRGEVDRLYKAFAINTALIWMMPILGLFLLGVSIAWVVKGFVKSRSNINGD